MKNDIMLKIAKNKSLRYVQRGSNKVIHTVMFQIFGYFDFLSIFVGSSKLTYILQNGMKKLPKLNIGVRIRGVIQMCMPYKNDDIQYYRIIKYDLTLVLCLKIDSLLYKYTSSFSPQE